MDKLSHICLVSSRLDLPGGIERTIVNLANLFHEKGHRVTILVLDEHGDCFYPLVQGIDMVQESVSFGIESKGNTITRKIKFLQDLGRFKKAIKTIQPDTIITTEYQFSIAAGILNLKKNARVISWEHHHFHWLHRNGFWQFLYKRYYPRLDKIVCQNTDELAFYEELGCDTIAIPYHLHLNPTFFQQGETKELLSIGWLIPRKGIDLLMSASGIILKKYPGWKWRVIGDGEMKDELMRFIRENELQNRLIVEKPVSHAIGNYYKNASIFVLTSRMESFGMVLAEAMCHGVPGIAFDCETGPRHVITDNEDGFLAEKENVPQLVAYISRLVDDPLLRKKMGEKAVANMHRFSPQVVYEQWKKLI